MAAATKSLAQGLCECGCGARTNLASRNFASRGWVKGQPLRFVASHSGRYRNNELGYVGLHKWVDKRRPRTGVCQVCDATGVRTENANLSGEYRRDLDDFLEMCCSCHREFDGR